LLESFSLAVMIDAVRGLAIAHSRGIVHRDFKPENVLLTADAKEWLDSLGAGKAAEATPLEVGKIYAKVSDFGLARTAQQSESMALTREGTLLGTPLYMSPEQCLGQPTDARSDVYSIGVTLFELLAGRPPFEADSQAALLNLHCNATPPSLKKLRPQLSDALVQIIDKCLAKNPEARYADAGELVLDLENILLGKPTSLGLHPPILSTNDPDILQFEHEWELQSTPQQLWPYISNTDRVNHAIGLPAVSYSIHQDPIQGAIRIAEAKISGLLIRWREHPYEWIEGKRLSVLREFSHGPFRWFVNVVELVPSLGGGTRVTQRLIVTPRNWIGKQIAKIQLGQRSKANFGRAYQQIDAFIVSAENKRADRDPFIGRTELRAAQRQRLHSRLDQLRRKDIDPRVVDTLGQFLENASDLEVARIRPIAFAERFGLEPRQVINACFEGTRLGVFTLLWDIICPSCRIPSSVQDTLAAIKDHGYCEACNLDFGIDLAESVELIFRVSAEIRGVTTAIYCIGGPAWSRHIVAQVRLAAGERFACETNLAEGTYVVRGQQLPFTIELRVTHGSLVKRVELSLSKPPYAPRIALAVDSQVIHLCNDSAVDQQIRIERTAGRHDALSAARASTMAVFRELFPGEVLSADQIVSVAHLTVMRVHILATQQLYDLLGDGSAFKKIRTALQAIILMVKEHAGAVVKTIGEGVLASFPDTTSAVHCAIELLRQFAEQELPITIAVHQGAAMVATLEDRLDYFGRTLQTLELLLRTAPAHSVQITSTITDSAEVQSYLRETFVCMELVPELELPEGEIAFKLHLGQSASKLATVVSGDLT
jgi:eukaryotic-like serine/threonine-protein kinase